MAKKRGIWPWLIAAGFVGYIIGSDDEKSITTSTTSITPNHEQTAAIEKTSKSAELKSAGTPDQKVIQKPLVKTVKKAPTPRTAISMYVDASRLNVRSGPDKTHKVIWTLKRDEKVSVTSKEGDWLFIEGRRFKGWVFGTYLTPKPSPKIKQATKSKSDGLTTSQIKKLLIKRSHAYYDGSCPCPYNRARNGSKCGGRSAYSRPGGAEPLCYESDVTEAMVAAFRARQ